MQVPVSMLKGIGGKSSTTAVLGLLVGLALIVVIKQAKTSPTASTPLNTY